MQDQANTPPAGGCGDQAQALVLALLLEPSGPHLWSLGEIARELGCELAAARAVVRLDAAGLVHRRNEFVWPTRATSRFRELLRE